MTNKKVFYQACSWLRIRIGTPYTELGKLKAKKLNKTKLSRYSLQEYIFCIIFKKFGHRKTGLYYSVPNPYAKYTIEQLGDKYKHLIGREEITLQEKLEYEHRKDPGFYSPKMTREGEPATYFTDFKFKLRDGTNVLDLTIPEHEIAYCTIRQ